MGTQPTRPLLVPPHAAIQPASSSAAKADALSPPDIRVDTLRHFDAVFCEAPASTTADLQEAFRLRYQVYCLDRGFEDAGSCPDGFERDDYDDLALHCLLRDRLGKSALGTVRLVMASAGPSGINGLPLADYAHRESIEVLASLPPTSTAEISRFAIARWAREILWQSQRASRAGCVPTRDLECSRLLPYMSLGLIRGLVRLSIEHGISHWCLAAEPSLLRRLRGFGLHFVNAGPMVEHRGLRQVCYANLQELLARVECEHPEFWDIITVGGFLLSDSLARNAA
jgi:N-acyl amino acid synthase of PEP-CTERM/exosortase system